MQSSVQSEVEINRFKLNNVLRDGIQSNQGTNLSADEIVDIFLNTTNAEYDEFQVAGGTFMDLFMKKGRDAFGENTKLLDAFRDVVTSALIRGDCLLAYDRSPQDVIDAVIEELAIRGLNVVTNFQGLNFAPAQKPVFDAVLKAQNKGHNIVAPKVLCIEDNPNITIQSCMAALEAQHSMGAAPGIYLKNASGKVDPEFVYELVKLVAEKYPGEKITLHTHDNHGLADAIYYFGAEAAAEMNASIAFDVLPRPMASGTAQPPAWRIEHMFQTGSERVKARTSGYDETAEAADFERQYAARHRYGGAEVRYYKKSWDACYEAGMAGGAMAALKGMGILPTIRGMYGLEDEDEALALVAEIEAQVKVMFGYPTSVTPYQKTMDEAAALEAELRKSDFRRKNKSGPYPPFSQLHANSVLFLSGGLGPVPASASQQLLKIALAEKGLTAIQEFVPADQLPELMEVTKIKLQDAGYAEPTQADVALAAMFGDEGFNNVMIRSGQSILPQHMQPEYRKKITEFNKFAASCPSLDLSTERENLAVKGRLKPNPQQPPEWPSYLQPPSADYAFNPNMRVISEYDIATAIGGAAALERFALAVTELQKHEDGFYKTAIGATGFYQRSKQGSPSSDAGQENATRVNHLIEVQKFAKQVAEKEVQDFMHYIPKLLEEYGMNPKQVAAALTIHLPELLQKVIAGKAKGASKRDLPKFGPRSNTPAKANAVRSQAPDGGAVPSGNWIADGKRKGPAGRITPNEPATPTAE